MPKVTIVLPYYNVGDYIDKCLNSLRNQSYLDFEVFCVNDGSKDHSDDIVQKYVTQDNRFRRFVKTNGGLSDARNFGLKYVESEFVMFLDSDDYFEFDLLENCVNKMIDETCDLVVFDYNQLFIRENRKELIRERFDENRIFNPKNDKELVAYLSNAAWNKIYRTQIFKMNKIEYPTGYRYEDLGTTFRYLTYCDRVGFINRPLANYLIDRPNNISGSSDIKIKDILIMVRMNIKFYKEHSLFNDYFEELKYLSAINCLNMLRKVPTMDNLKFVYEFIDETFRTLTETFNDFPKCKYSLMDLPQSSIYFNKTKLKLYVYYKYVLRRIKRIKNSV
ncbi:MAG TPA: glycosyltransferase family 2 protein [Erysipelotrichaceae bacterium]|nr:glycosyltransferase family 2 protein [Erysipelotrichaceae bacterium]